MKHIIMNILSIVAAALLRAQDQCLGLIPAANTYDAAVETHNNSVRRTNDAAVSTRHLLWKKGASDGTVALNGASDIPLGTIDNVESSTGLGQTILLLGKGATKKMVASEAIGVGARVFAAASGKVAASGTILLGIALTAAGQDDDILEVADITPVQLAETVSSVAVDADELAIPVTARLALKTTGADAEALTLADGVPGQRLSIILDTDGGGDGTLTPTTATGFATIVFADAGDRADLEFVDDTLGWIIVGLSGVSAAPASTV